MCFLPAYLPAHAHMHGCMVAWMHGWMDGWMVQVMDFFCGHYKGKIVTPALHVAWTRAHPATRWHACDVCVQHYLQKESGLPDQERR